MKGADEMHMRGTIDQCKGEVHLRGARTRASDMCKIKKRRRACEARTKMVPRGLQRAVQVRSMDPKKTPRGSQRVPKGDPNHKKSLLEAIWTPQEK